MHLSIPASIGNPIDDVPSYMSGLFKVDKEGTELQRELQMLEKQYVFSNMCAESVNEAVQLLQENFPPDRFQENLLMPEKTLWFKMISNASILCCTSSML
ncbi:hypothetical protein Scep_022288 [Stephania cephalantha]|uniref:Uncharacterized protein n=1 Tax=Stephania cephalantha TaxID=152367 RepID=A0AAP0FGY6_9MAGN